VDRTAKWREVPWGIAAAIALHALLALLLSAVPVPRRPDPTPDARLEVEIVRERTAPSDATPLSGGHHPPLRPDAAEPAPAVEARHTDVPPAGAMIRADHFMSGLVLADPRSGEARAALAGFATPERMEQLCGIEAMEQVHAWNEQLLPDSVVAYAMADTKITGRTVEADGAAIRSKQQWFNLKFRCSLSADLTEVVAFEFQVEKPIPRSAWEEHNLADETLLDE
jgi:hypothetical protein